MPLESVAPRAPGRHRRAEPGPRGACGRRAAPGRQARAGSPFFQGVLEALLVPLAFAALGLSWWGTLDRPEGADRATTVQPNYSLSPMDSIPASAAETPPEAPSIWLVDGFNVVQVGLLRGRDRDRWWSAPRREELLAQVAEFERADAELWVVFDGNRASPASDPASRVQTVYAPSADAWLVSRVKAADDPNEIVVVTADRRLANRVRHVGARVVTPGDFLRACGHDPEAGTVRAV